jgi:hypothetical protein
MILEEEFDADEILRDVGEKTDDADDGDVPEDIRELNFGTRHDHNANFNEMANDLDIS